MRLCVRRGDNLLRGFLNPANPWASLIHRTLIGLKSLEALAPAAASAALSFLFRAGYTHPTNCEGNGEPIEVPQGIRLMPYELGKAKLGGKYGCRPFPDWEHS